MASYLIRRLLIGLLTLWLITFFVYALIRNMPGDPVSAAAGSEDPSMKTNGERDKRNKEFYGLDQPWYVAYWDWLWKTAHGDLNISKIQKERVDLLIAARIGPTLLLSITSLSLAYLLSIPMGLYSAARAGKFEERIMSVVLYMLYSLPFFVAALFLQSLFAVRLQGTWLDLPLFMMTSDNYDELSVLGKAVDLFRHMVLPVTCYTYGALAYEARFIRANLMEVMRQDYIRTARAKGLGPTAVLVKHAFRNTLIQFVTAIGLTLPALLSGSVILEKIFTWPGMGQLFFDSIGSRDYPVIMGMVLMFSVLTLLSQLLADILYAVVDPRVTYS